MKKIFGIILITSGLISSTSCVNRDFKIIKDYLVEMPTYTTLDYDYVADYFKNEPIKLGACSAIVQDVGPDAEHPHLIFGRNMDYAYSKKAAYIIRTNEQEEGTYKTVGLAYATNKNSPDWEDLKRNGISEKWRKIVPFFCTDIINEHGLYCEIDMRNTEYNPDGTSKFRCSGTNPVTGVDVHMVALTRFVVNHCKTVPEAIEYVKHNINVFNNEEDWNFSFLLGDAEGNFGLLEFGHNDIYFDDTKNCHTNYFLNGDLGPKSDTEDGESENHFGIGRYKYLTEHISSVTNATTMFNLMDQVSYSNVYKGLQKCLFDMKSEAYHTVTIDGSTDYTFKEFMSNEEPMKSKVENAINAKMKELEGMAQEEKEKLSWYWQSTFTNVIDIPSRTIHTRMFENKDYVFDIKL